MTFLPDTVRGVKWNGVSQAFKLSLYFLTTVILTRILDPNDFGLLGMATVYTNLIAVFNDFGMGSAIIQNQNLNKRNLSTIFWLSLFIGTSALCISVGAAPFVARFYDQPLLSPLISFMSLSFLFSSLGQVQLALIVKSLSFKKIMIIESSSGLIGCIIAIIMAFLNYGVWSLAAQIVVTSGISTLILWLTAAWIPKPIFEAQGLKRVLGFSSGLLSFNLLNYFSRNADYLLIGRFFGSALLGQYTFAYRLMQIPLQNFSSVVSRVLFPTLSKLQDNDYLFQRVFIKASQYVAFITFPLMTSIFLLSYEFVIIVFGEKWLPAVPVIKILAPLGMVQSVVSLVGNIYTAKGKTNWLFLWGLISSIITVTFLIAGLKWGILGVAAGYAFATYLLIFPNFKIPFRFINLPFSHYFYSLRRQIITTSAAGIIVYFSISLQGLAGLSTSFLLISNATLFFVVYYFFVLVIDRQTLIGLVEAILGKYSSIALKYVPNFEMKRLNKDL